MNFKFPISNFKCQILKLSCLVLLLFTFHFLLFTFLVQSAFAASCPAAGTKVPGDQQLTGGNNTNHEYTGRDCSAIRNSSGSIAGPSQFGRTENYRCLGGCKYEVNYCTPGGCEAIYPQEECSSAPASCNNPNTGALSPISQVFGKIIPPQQIINFGFGAKGISTLLSNIITLFYSIAIIVLIFMLLWGAWDWMTSEGDKEKLSSAQKKIVNAIIGIMLFAVAFAIIQVLGTFTGFTFFKRGP